MRYNVDAVMDVLSTKGFPIFSNDKSPYNLNIVGIRNSDRTSNKFNDVLCVFYKYNGDWVFNQFDVTLDPGTIYRLKPVNDDGTAIILPGHYKGLWKIGKHRGKYTALVQNKSCTVIRDNNKDTNLDVEIPIHFSTKASSANGITQIDYIDRDGNVVFVTQTGMFGINCHKSGKGITEDVSYYSAGCVVFSDNYKFDNILIPICNAAADIFGNSFSFTLLIDNDFRLV